MPKILPALERRFFPGDFQQAENAWNDALTNIWFGIDNFDESRGRFLNWVRRHAEWAARAIQRKRWGTDVPCASEGDNRQELPEGASRDPLSRGLLEMSLRQIEDTQPLTRLERQALRRAIARLRKQEVHLLWAREVRELRDVEISRLGVGGWELPAEHVRVYAQRACERLRRHYEVELRLLREGRI
jgi:hypothetical protein